MAHPDATPANIATPSRLMAWCSTFGFFLLPAVTIYAFVAPHTSLWLELHMDHFGLPLSHDVPFALRMIALVCALGAEAFTMWALWSLRLLFLHYARGEVFSAAALSALHQVAVALFASVVVGFIAQAPISLALSWVRGAGHREISLGFGSNDVATLFMACVVLVIARVMAQAQRMAEENAKFV